VSDMEYAQFLGGRQSSCRSPNQLWAPTKSIIANRCRATILLAELSE
jgi:hypothetical protein